MPCSWLRTLRQGFPDSLLLRHSCMPAACRCQAPQVMPMERYLKRALRERSVNSSPLRLNVVRATLADDQDTGGEPASPPPTQVIAKLPALVRDAASGLRATLLGIRSAATLAMGSEFSIARGLSDANLIYIICGGGKLLPLLLKWCMCTAYKFP
ncbi:unnamed protein product [Durusdinium trenchii]|uniref:Uncharacterized protein n=1 Tax=Durusdinium trenchii TaxID=1381693 RepID=A0ABP0LCW7_9DINO